MDLVALVERARTGDVEAFTELVRRHQTRALGSALALLRDPDRARDVVQEAFVAAWRGLARLADPAAFPAWLRGIVRRQAFHAMRARHLEPLAEAEDLAGDAPSADQQMETARRRALALSALADLPGGPARARRAPLRSRLLAGADRGIPRPSAHNGQQPAARGTRADQEEDARDGEGCADRSATGGLPRAIARDAETSLAPGMQVVERGAFVDGALSEPSLRSALARLVRPAPAGPPSCWRPESRSSTCSCRSRGEAAWRFSETTAWGRRSSWKSSCGGSRPTSSRCSRSFRSPRLRVTLARCDRGRRAPRDRGGTRAAVSGRG